MNKNKNKSIKLPKNQTLHQVKIAIVGHVDHGKSTLVGRLLHDTGSLPEGKFEAIKAMSERRGMPFEFAFVMDAFQAERDQAITIDAAHIWFKSTKRNYVIVDAPGHKEFIKNMISGSASCDVALLVIDGSEGLREQSRRHTYILNMLGISNVVVAVNKMDLVQYNQSEFDRVQKEVKEYFDNLGLKVISIVPIIAREGDNIVQKSKKMSWYVGPTVLESFDTLEILNDLENSPLRMPVQDIYHFDSRIIIAGKVTCGVLKSGDNVIFSPSNRKAQIKNIITWPEEFSKSRAKQGESVGITLKEQLFIERGELMSHISSPPLESNVFRSHLFWLAQKPLKVGEEYKLRINTFETSVKVQEIDRVIDTDDLSAGKEITEHLQVKRNDIAEVIFRSRSMLAIDEFSKNKHTGRFVLLNSNDIVAGGVISMKGYPDQRDLITEKGTNLYAVGHRVPVVTRVQRNGHYGGVVWLTGLSGAGKSSIALEAERLLFKKGYSVYLLDGDNVRSGLNSNLSFSPEDRAENIRRVGEVAALFADAGMVVITAFISPYRADRDRARGAMERINSEGPFHEVFVRASLEVCEERDPKGLYKRARAGEVSDFTGISAPYEEPEKPDLIVDTDDQSLEQSVDVLVQYILRKFQDFSEG